MIKFLNQKNECIQKEPAIQHTNAKQRKNKAKIEKTNRRKTLI